MQRDRHDELEVLAPPPLTIDVVACLLQSSRGWLASHFSTAAAENRAGDVRGESGDGMPVVSRGICRC